MEKVLFTQKKILWYKKIFRDSENVWIKNLEYDYKFFWERLSVFDKKSWLYYTHVVIQYENLILENQIKIYLSIRRTSWVILGFELDLKELSFIKKQQLRYPNNGVQTFSRISR